LVSVLMNVLVSDEIIFSQRNISGDLRLKGLLLVNSIMAYLCIEVMALRFVLFTHPNS
jgi:hypothetical protein